ncbi:unnamed protein product [Caenorhabditis auriculariae]|uniref:Uncharacterized protein n=1 Tax=Caenorhabditis auriculariae TaxID=2777116 RepID=A0A8S1HWB7_9PELO|nr:unnamed protein product [Caenorhabditis auriculariae]
MSPVICTGQRPTFVGLRRFPQHTLTHADPIIYALQGPFALIHKEHTGCTCKCDDELVCESGRSLGEMLRLAKAVPTA